MKSCVAFTKYEIGARHGSQLKFRRSGNLGMKKLEFKIRLRYINEFEASQGQVNTTCLYQAPLAQLNI